MELYLTIAALAAVLVCIILLIFQNNKFRRMEDLEKQLSQLQSQLQESQKGDAALAARQDLLIQSVETSLEKLQTNQAHNAMQTEQKLDQMRRGLGESLERMQAGNQAQLDGIRKTVDEKLQQTLDRKLNDSFQLVSQRLEQVYKGLGDQKNKPHMHSTWHKYLLINFLSKHKVALHIMHLECRSIYSGIDMNKETRVCF